MPGLVVFRRRWSVGSDDLVVPGAFLLTIHLICLITVTVSLCTFVYDTSILDIKLLFYHQVGYLVIMCVSLSIEIGICFISMRGSILDSDVRAPINIWIYLKSAVMLFDISWLILGSIWLSEYYLESPINTPKKIFFAMMIANWALVFVTVVTVWCTFDAAGRSWVKMKKYQRSMRETESRFNYKRSNSMNRNWRQRKVIRAYQDSWDHRCRLLFCCMGSSEQTRNSFTDIARLLSDFFRELDVVPSDVVAGLVLLRKFQRLEREAIVRQRKNGTYEFLSGVPITERTKFLALNDAKNYDFFQTVIHYMYFAQGAYGWPMYFMINRSKICNLIPELKCFGCCNRTTDEAEVIQDNCCYCNYAALKKTLQVGDIEVVYATYHVDIGETPFFVAIDYTQKKIVVSIRGTLSMKDILTDLNAEAEVLPLKPPRDDWLGHKGMVQAAIYIRQKLEEENIIQKALNKNPERNTHTFGLVLVGHSLGAGAAAILAILMKPEHPTLQCFSYSPPGGLLSMPAVEYSKTFITSVVLGKDVVPRIGLYQMEALRADLINAIQRSIDPKWKTISCSMLCCGCGPEPKSVVEMSGQDTHINKYQQERDTARSTSTHPADSSIALTLHQPLYPPGRIIHIVRHHPKADENVLKNRDPVYQAIWADSSDFDEVLISPVMLQDHMPDKVLAALKKMENAMHIRIDELLMPPSSSSSSTDEDDEIGRREVRIPRPHRMMQRVKIKHYDEVDFHKYYRMKKNIFFRLLDLVRYDIDGNPARPRELSAEAVVTTSGPRKPHRQASNAFSTASNDLHRSNQDVYSCYNTSNVEIHHHSEVGSQTSHVDTRPNAFASSSTHNRSEAQMQQYHAALMQQRVCLETSFTNLQSPLMAHKNAPFSESINSSKASSLAGSVLSRSQVSSIQYDISSVVENSIATVQKGKSPVPKTVYSENIHPKEPHATWSPVVDTSVKSLHSAHRNLQRHSSEKTGIKPKSLPIPPLRRASINTGDQAAEDGWGVAPLASPETLSEISSISSRNSTRNSVGNSIDHHMNNNCELSRNNTTAATEEKTYESQLHTPKVLRRAPKFTENLSTCAEDKRNLDQYKRMGCVFINHPFLNMPPQDSSEDDDDDDDSFESATSYIKKSEPNGETKARTGRLSENNPDAGRRQNSKSADQLDDVTSIEKHSDVIAQKLTFSDSNILDEGDFNLLELHSNSMGSNNTAFFSANSSIERVACSSKNCEPYRRHDQRQIIIPQGVLETHFSLDYDAFSMLPEPFPTTTSTKKCLSNEDDNSKHQQKTVPVQIPKISSSPSIKGRKRNKNCIYPSGPATPINVSTTNVKLSPATTTTIALPEILVTNGSRHRPTNESTV